MARIRKSFLLVLVLMGVHYIYGQHQYTLFNQKGEKLAFNQLVDSIATFDVVIFGEHHGDSIGHALERQLLEALYQKDSAFLLSMEMFEQDDQLIIDEYLKGFYSERTFESEVKLWSNYSKDYQPLIQFSKTNNIPVLAANIPRRYANMVFHQGVNGLHKLDSNAFQYICPLPFSVDSTNLLYSEVVEMVPKGHEATNFLYAQAIKDATMGYFIAQKVTEGNKVFHINGAFHSKYKLGVAAYVSQYYRDSNVVTISLVNQKSMNKLKPKNSNIADFLVVIKEKK